jgi:hypothetical protein
MKIEETQPENQIGRDALKAWKNAISQNIYTIDHDFQHNIQYYFGKNYRNLEKELTNFAEKIINEVEPLVIENTCAIVKIILIEHIFFFLALVSMLLFFSFSPKGRRWHAVTDEGVFKRCNTYYLKHPHPPSAPSPASGRRKIKMCFYIRNKSLTNP